MILYNLITDNSIIETHKAHLKKLIFQDESYLSSLLFDEILTFRNLKKKVS